MTNLPITSNSALPSGNATNAALANSAADIAQTAAVTGESAPFAALLARQIDGADSALLNLAQLSIGADAANSDTASGAQNPSDTAALTAGTGVPVDAANSVMAMLMQLPQESRPAALQNTSDNTSISSTGQSNAPGMVDVSMLKTATRGDMQESSPAGVALDGSQVKNGSQNLVPGGSQNPVAAGSQNAAPGKTGTTLADQQIKPETLFQDMVKQAELPATQTASAPANASQTIAPSALAAAMPNMQPGKTVDNPQTIATPLGNSGWSDEFSQKISWMSTQKNQVAELHLNPPDLGPLDVVLKISDSQATALFTSPHGAVREAVENALPKLREMLADNGITLGNTTVSDQPPRDREAQGFMGQGSGTAAQHGESGGSAGQEGMSSATAQVATARRHNGMVDTFA